jgi:hypothetical protein
MTKSQCRKGGFALLAGYGIDGHSSKVNGKAVYGVTAIQTHNCGCIKDDMVMVSRQDIQEISSSGTSLMTALSNRLEVESRRFGYGLQFYSFLFVFMCLAVHQSFLEDV